MCELILPFTLVEITQILWEEGLNLAVCALPTNQTAHAFLCQQVDSRFVDNRPPHTPHTRRRKKKMFSYALRHVRILWALMTKFAQFLY